MTSRDTGIDRSTVGLATAPGTDVPRTDGPTTDLPPTMPPPPTTGATAAPLRIGLAISGAEVTGAFENLPHGVAPEDRPGARLTFASADGSRTLWVLSTPAPEDQRLPDSAMYVGEPPIEVDLGGGRIARYTRAGEEVPGPFRFATVELTVNGASVNLSGHGLSEAEMLDAARAVTVPGDAGSTTMADLPADLVAAPPSSPYLDVEGARSSVQYRLPDGVEVAVEVYRADTTDSMSELAPAQANPTAQRYATTVRGVDAFVGLSDGTGVTGVIKWVEPTGELVVLLLNTATTEVDPDVAAIVAGVTELDEASFQAVLAAHPVTTLHA